MRTMVLALLLVAAGGSWLATPAQPVRAWDGVFAPADLALLAKSGDRRSHSYTTIFDRRASPDGRTVIERALASLLDALGDEAPYVEYWWRGEWKSIASHRDVDETLCLSRKHAGSANGVQRCPDHGHVLYVDVHDEVRGPTCVWVEEGSANRQTTGEEGEDRRAGAPRPLRSLYVVPCREGRLLRFSGELLHAVPNPPCEWLVDEESASDGGDTDDVTAGAAAAAAIAPGGVSTSEEPKRRGVVLFNTWTTPPLVPAPDDPPPPKSLDELAALPDPPTCQPRDAWGEATAASPEAADHESAAAATVEAAADAASARVRAPLLGTEQRRNCEADALFVSAHPLHMRAALTSSQAVHAVALQTSARDVAASDAAAVARRDEGASRAEDGGVEVDTGEEAAVKVGYLDFMEDEFFDMDDDDDDDEYEEEDDEDAALPSDFWANVARLQTAEEDRSRGPGVGNEI